MHTVRYAILVVLLLMPGCSEPFTAYRLPGDQSYVAQDTTILVMPFMDTRTFIDKSDTHRADLGAHVRDIFVDSMRAYNANASAAIITPPMPQPMKSLTNAEVADIGRAHNADYVVAGQVFSYTGTRAISIPPRAGMFVRVISVADGSLLYVGDHYQAAAFPGAPGGRELQARNVAGRLIEGFIAKARVNVAAAVSVAATGALAMLPTVPFSLFPTPAGVAGSDNGESPEPPPDFPGLAGGTPLSPDDWEEQAIPEVPPLRDFQQDFYNLPDLALPELPPAAEAESADLPSSEAGPAAVSDPVTAAVLQDIQERRETAAAEPERYPAGSADATAELAEPAADASTAVAAAAVDTAASAQDAAVEIAATPAAAPSAEPAQLPADPVAHSDAAAVIDELPEFDFRALNLNMINADAPPDPSSSSAADLSGDELAEDLWTLADTPPAAKAADAAGNSSPSATGESAAGIRPASRPAPVFDNGPVLSVPLAVEQPSTERALTRELSVDPAATQIDGAAQVEALARGSPGGIRVLILPYHDLGNDNNLIANTGGGEVVTTLYGTQLALDRGVTLMWDGSGEATHDRLVGRDEAIEMGRLAGADYVIRGQVLEFRRAQSVPSFYSAVISTAMLAAQFFFAEMSGVDVATEVYRVADGECVMSRRDRAQQKYVVQAEKTVRRMAEGMAESVWSALRNPRSMDPIIDSIPPPVTLASVF